MAKLYISTRHPLLFWLLSFSALFHSPALSGQAIDSIYGTITPPVHKPGVSCLIQVTSGPYVAYSWSNGATTSSISVKNTGTYSVTVTGPNGQTATRKFNVESGTLRPAYCIVQQTVNCQTQTVKFETFAQCSSTGEIWADNVTWNTGQAGTSITVTPPGIYSYSCATDPGFVAYFDLPAFFDGPLTISGPNVLCPGDAGVLEVNMPNSPNYSFPNGNFTWTPPNQSGQLTPYEIQGAGSYTLQVEDAYGCPFAATKTVQQSPPVLPHINGQFFMCSEGDTAALNVSPAFSSYNWAGGQTSQGIAVTEPGSYTVTVTNSFGCTGETDYTINSADVDTIFGTVSAPAICPGTPSVLQIVGGPYTLINWSTGAHGQSVTVNQPGTYTVTVTNPFGCTGARQFVVNPAPPPAPALNAPAICAGASAVLSVSGGNFSTYAWTGGSNAATLTVSTPGTYTVTVGDGTGCTGTATTTVQAAPPAVPSIAGLTEVCAPATAVLQASGGFSSYAWSLPGGASGGNSPSVTAAQSGTYVVTVSNAAGCTGTTSQSFLINPAPAPVVGIAPYACNGQMSLSTNAGFANYQWSNGAVTPGISTQMDGTYTVTVTSGAGCTGTAQTNVVIPPDPATSITGVSTLCPGVSGQLTASGTYNSYVWTGGQSGASITATAPGTYNVTVTDPNGCTATATRIVSPAPALVPIVGGPLEICVGGTASISVNGNFDHYQWSTGGNTASISASQTGNYSVTVTNDDGCTGSATHALVVGNELSPQIVAAPYACNGQVNLSAGAGFSSYQWSNSAATSGIAVNASGAYQVTVTDNTGCSGTANFNVNIPPAPVVNIAGNGDLCAGTTTQLSATAGFAGYAWSGGQNTPSIVADASGSFAVTVTDQFGCTATDDFGVTVYPPILPDIAGPAAICQNTSATLTLNTSFSAYQWSNGASTPNISVNQNGPFSVTVTDAIGCTAVAEHGLLVNPAPAPVLQQNLYDCDHAIDLTCNAGFANYAWSTGSQNAATVATASGDYVVTVADAIGCTGTAVVAVAIPADPFVTIATAQPFCLGGSGQLQASGSFQNYIWSSGQATTGISVNQAGNYAVTVTDQFGCTATAATNVTVLPLPQPLVQGPPEICAGAPFSLSVTGGTYTQFAWSDGSNGATTQISFPGTYNVTVTDQNGCKNTDDFTVAPGTPPLASVGPDQTLTCVQNAVQLSGAGSSSGPGISYEWVALNGSAIQGSTTLTPIVTAAGIYRLIVSNAANGCSSSASVTVNQSADLPLVEVAQPLILTCTNTEMQLDANGTSAGPDFQYLWTASGTGHIVSGATTLMPTIDKPGTYTLQVLNTSNNCASSAGVTVSQDIQAPVVSVGPPDTLTCAQPYLAVQTITISSSSQILTYEWSTLDGHIQSGNNASAALLNAAGTYTVLVTDLVNGCTGTATKLLDVDVNLPMAEIAQPQVLTCARTTVALNATASSFGALFNYVWKTSDGHIVDQSNIQMPTVDQPGEYMLLITNVNNGCADSMVVEVLQNISTPVLDAGEGDELTCLKTALQLAGWVPVPEPDLLYSWTTPNGNIVSGGTTLTPTIDAPGTYILVVNDSSIGCTASSTVVVTEDVVAPALSSPAPATLTCVVKTVSLTANVNGQGNAPTYLWTTANGNITTPTNGPSISVDQPGTYLFTATNTENGCTSTLQTVVEQNIAPPPVSIQDPLLLTCARTSVGLQAVFGQNLTAQWTTPNGQILSGANSATPTVGQIGTYQVLVTNPLDGCTNSAEIQVNEETNRPEGLDFGLVPPDCTGKKGTVRVDTVFGGIQPLSYSINGGQSFGSASQFANLLPGDYDLVVRDANGCTHAEPLSVPEPVEPAVSLPPVFELQFGDSLRLEPVFPANFPLSLVDTAYWRPLHDLTFESMTMPDLLTPYAKPFRATSYTLTVVTPEGCTAQARSDIKVLPPHIYVPNVIQTNGPQQAGNESFTIYASPRAVAMIRSLQVFDRWGEQVFVNKNFLPNDPESGWKGNFREKQNTPAVFVWYAEVLMQNGEIEFLKGDVTVMR